MLSFKKRWYDVIDMKGVRILALLGHVSNSQKSCDIFVQLAVSNHNVGKAAVVPLPPTSWESWGK